jgi:hypothetical protein
MAHLPTTQVLPLDGARLLGRQPRCRPRPIKLTLGLTVEF